MGNYYIGMPDQRGGGILLAGCRLVPNPTRPNPLACLFDVDRVDCGTQRMAAVRCEHQERGRRKEGQLVLCRSICATKVR